MNSKLLLIIDCTGAALELVLQTSASIDTQRDAFFDICWVNAPKEFLRNVNASFHIEGEDVLLDECLKIVKSSDYFIIIKAGDLLYPFYIRAVMSNLKLFSKAHVLRFYSHRGQRQDASANYEFFFVEKNPFNAFGFQDVKNVSVDEMLYCSTYVFKTEYVKTSFELSKAVYYIFLFFESGRFVYNIKYFGTLCSIFKPKSLEIYSDGSPNMLGMLDMFRHKPSSIGESASDKPLISSIKKNLNCVIFPIVVNFSVLSLLVHVYYVFKSSSFDSAFYRKNFNFSVFIPSVLHFCMKGWKQGYDPSPSFSCREYFLRHYDVYLAKVNPLFHYERYGKFEFR